MNSDSNLVKSYAKINLFLDVLSKQSDGYHKIRTIFSEIDLYDRLNFILTKERHIKILSNKNFVEEKENLIYKVADYLQNKYKINSGVEIVLEKNIPVQAGLGGGSSNAATTLKALSELWSIGLTGEKMNEAASLFGSDINFFLYGGTALGVDRGQKIKKIDNIHFDNILLVKPDFGISSKEAYNLVEPGKGSGLYKLLIENKDAKFCFNKLEDKIIKNNKTIAKIKSDLELLGAKKAILSGSGPTVIGFFPDKKTAEVASKFFSESNFWNCITKTKGESHEHYRRKSILKR